MRRLSVAVLGGSLALVAASEAQAQPQDQQQPPLAQQPQVVQGQVVQTGGNGQPTIIVVQGGGNNNAAPKKRRTIPAEEGQPPPPGYHTEGHMMKGLAIAGWTVFGSGYILTVLGGAFVGLANTISDGGVGSSGYVGLIPVAGPWIYVANSNLGDARIYFGLMGVLQAGGLAMGIAGLAVHTDVWVSDDAKNHYGPRIGVGPGNLSFTTNF